MELVIIFKQATQFQNETRTLEHRPKYSRQNNNPLKPFGKMFNPQTSIFDAIKHSKLYDKCIRNLCLTKGAKKETDVTWSKPITAFDKLR